MPKALKPKSKPKPRRLIPMNEVGRLFAEGKGVVEIARITGFTKGGISLALKRLQPNIAKAVALNHADEVVEKELNALEQMQKINANANEMLDLLMRWNRGDDEALQILESQVRKIKVRGSEEEVTEYKFKDPRELALKAMAEIRGQINLQLEIFKFFYDHKAVQEFEREVLQGIANAEHIICPKCGERTGARIVAGIIQNLKKTGAIYSALDFDRGAIRKRTPTTNLD